MQPMHQVTCGPDTDYSRRKDEAADIKIGKGYGKRRAIHFCIEIPVEQSPQETRQDESKGKFRQCLRDAAGHPVIAFDKQHAAKKQAQADHEGAYTDRIIRDCKDYYVTHSAAPSGIAVAK